VTAPVPPCEPLEWDSAFFGRRIARAATAELTTESWRAVRGWCADHRTECLYFLAVADDRATTGLLESVGFHLVDVRVTLDREVTAADGNRPRQGTRAATPADVPALRRIAGAAHRNTRFYADGHFDRERCDELYRIWIEKSCLDQRNHVLVVERHGEPVGYLTLQVEDGTATIGLVGVSPPWRQRGVGRELLSEGLAWLATRSVAHVSVVTQGSSVAAQRLYQGLGFRTANVALWYHRWFS